MRLQHPGAEADYLVFTDDEQEEFCQLVGLFRRYLAEYEPDLYRNLAQHGVFERILQRQWLVLHREDQERLEDLVHFTYWAIGVYRPTNAGELVEFLWRLADTLELTV